MDKEKIIRFGEIAGVGWRQAYRYLNGYPVPPERVDFITGSVGGKSRLWLFKGGSKSKKELFDKAEIWV